MIFKINLKRSKGRFKEITERVEIKLIRHALKVAGSKLGAARYLGIARSSLRDKIKKHKIK